MDVLRVPRIPEMMKIKLDVYTRDCESEVRCMLQGNGPIPNTHRYQGDETQNTAVTLLLATSRYI